MTVIYAGVDVSDAGFWGRQDSQQRRRTINSLSLHPYEITDDASRREWIAILNALEQRLLLADHRQDSFARLHEEIWARTGGNLKSLDTLFVTASAKAISTGKEAIDEALLSTIETDYASQELYRDRRAELKVLKKLSKK